MSHDKTFINLFDNLNIMTSEDLTSLMAELLNKDRFEYIEMIMNSEGGARSFDIAEKILQSREITEVKKIKKENIVVNKRLRRLVELGILVPKEKGKYDISNLGYLLMDSWEELKESKEIFEKFHNFFNSHYITDLPREFFLRIYKLKKAELTKIPIQWAQEVIRHMEKMERKFYNLTEYLHDIPKEVIEKKKKEEIEEIVIIYQFKKYPELNFPIEKELFYELVDAGVEFRYLTLEKRRPIGIRIVDEIWATFGLPRIPDGILDRERAFIGTDLEFISWCRDLMYHIWHFEAKRLDVEKVIVKEEK